MSCRQPSRRGIKRGVRRTCRAFTLIEILVVLIIIAVISAVALLSLGILGDDRNLQNDVRRLTTLIELANEESTVLGRDLGLEFSASGYRFVEFDPLLNRWYEVIGDDLLRARRLESGLEFDLVIEDRRVLLDLELASMKPPEPAEDDADDEGDDPREEENAFDEELLDEYQPHILIMSSGDISPFTLRVLAPEYGSEITLTMTLTGEMEVQNNAEDVL